VFVLRLTRRSWLGLILIAATIIGSIGSSPPPRASATTPLASVTFAPTPQRRTVLPPSRAVPVPLRRPARMTLVRAHGFSFRMPARAPLTPALRALVFGQRLHAAGAAPRGQTGASHTRLRHAHAQEPAVHSRRFGAVQGQFFADAHNSGTYTSSDGVFTVKPGTPPLFTPQFQAIDFNPPPAAQRCSNGTGVGTESRPFVDVIPRADGSCVVQTVQGNGAQAGVDLSGRGGPNMEAFQAVFTAYVTVAKAGPISFHFYADDGWIMALGPDAAGDQPVRDPNSPSGSAQVAPGTPYPTNGPFTGYPVVAADDQTTPPAANDFTVDFPAAGTYPVEVDYTECCQGSLALTLGTQYGDPLLPATVSSVPGDLLRNPQNCPCSQAQLFLGGPFNTRTGNLYADDTDLAVTSPGPPLIWARTYNSQATGDVDMPGALGYGWQQPYATHLITSGAPGGEPGVAIVVSPTGNKLRFEDLGNGQFQPFPGVYSTLVQAGGVYTETRRTQEQVVYNATGQATTMYDAHGGELALQYNGSQLTKVADVANPARYLALDYDAFGAHIVAVHDPAGRTVRYTYDATTGDLTGTTDVMGRTASYHYQGHLLTERDNMLGQPLEQTTYDSYTPSGRVVGQTLQDGRRYTVTYASASTTITTTGSDGTQSVEQVLYDPQRNTMQGLVRDGVLVQQVSFDGNFSPGLQMDADGNPTTTTYNTVGLPLSVTNAEGDVSQVSYDVQDRPITATDPLGRQAVFGYDANNNLVTQTTGITTGAPLGATTVYTYNVRYSGRNWIEEQRTPDGVVSHYDYDQSGQMTLATIGYGTAQAQATAYGYDVDGRVVTTTVGVGTSQQRTDVTRYNDDNTVKQTILDYTGNGVFDPAHPDQNVATTYGYDAVGRASWVRDPLGHYGAVHYDASGQTDWSIRNLSPVALDSQGQVIIPATPPAFSPARPDVNVSTLYGYDGLGRTTLVTDTGILTGTFDVTSQTFAGTTTRVTQTEYDSFDRPVTTTLDYRPDLPVGQFPDANLQSVTQYDPQGNATWDRDALGRWTRTQYDQLNRPVTTTLNYENGDPLTVDPANQSWTDGHDTDIVQVTRYRPDTTVAQEIDNYVDGVFTASEPITDRITQYAYDAVGRVITTTLNTDPATLGARSDTNRTSAVSYDPTSGQVLGDRDALGRWTSYVYDGLGRLTTTTENCRDTSGNPMAQGCAPFDAANAPDRNVSSQTRYDVLGRAFETVDPLGHVTHTTYDGLGQEVAIAYNYVPGTPATSDTNITSRASYDALGRTTVMTDAVGAPTTYGYDNLGQTVAVTDAAGRVTHTGYDGTGAERWTETPNGRFTVMQVDGLGRVVAEIVNYHTGVVTPATPSDQDLTTRTAYDRGGRRVQSVDEAGHVTTYGYDLLDNTTVLQENVQNSCSAGATDCNVTTQYGYDRGGRRVSMTDPRGNTQHFAYNAADEQTAATDALTRTTTREYDALGRVTVQHDPRGPANDLVYTYDGLDRVTKLSAQNLPAPIQTQYDALGQRTSLTDGTGTTSFTHDALGRTTAVKAPGTGQVGYTYDAAGRRTSVQYPDSTSVVYTYYPDGQLQAATQSGATLASYTYDAAGRLSQAARSNGAVTTYSYDGADRLLDLSTTVKGAPVSRFTDQVDRLGDRTEITETLPLTTATTSLSGSRVSVLDTSSSDCHLVVQGGTLSASALTANGASGSALCLNGGVITATAITVQGGIRKQGGAITGTVTTNQPATTDPFSATVPPSKPGVACPGAACPDGTNFNAGGTYRLLPGYYGQTLNLNNGATICVAPGAYYLDASWNVGAALRPYGSAGCPALPAGTTDAGVLLYFHAGILQINSGGNVTRLSALASGSDAGVLYWQASATANAPNGAFGGGAWYEPAGALTLNSGATITATVVVAADLTVNGGATLAAIGASAPVPTTSGGPTTPISATRVITYAYDGLQRLTDAVENPGTAYHYSYDLAGNRTDVSVNGGPIAHTAYDAADQVVGWTYDAAGNVISDTTRSSTYDALNRQTGLSMGPLQETYAYNGDGTLVSQTVGLSTMRFTQDIAGPQSEILQAQASSGATTDYLYGLDRLAASSGGARTWYGTDLQGSVRYTMDNAGNAGMPRNYDPFGAPEGAPMPDLFGYGGEMQDAATGLEYLRARWYSPQEGQFSSRDPLESATGQPYASRGRASGHRDCDVRRPDGAGDPS